MQMESLLWQIDLCIIIYMHINKSSSFGQGSCPLEYIIDGFVVDWTRDKVETIIVIL